MQSPFIAEEARRLNSCPFVVPSLRDPGFARKKTAGVSTGGLFENGAGEETRTLDVHLGKVVLYQLSYARERAVRSKPRPVPVNSYFDRRDFSLTTPLNQTNPPDEPPAAPPAQPAAPQCLSPASGSRSTSRSPSPVSRDSRRRDALPAERLPFSPRSL